MLGPTMMLMAAMCSLANHKDDLGGEDPALDLGVALLPCITPALLCEVTGL